MFITQLRQKMLPYRVTKIKYQTAINHQDLQNKSPVSVCSVHSDRSPLTANHSEGGAGPAVYLHLCPDRLEVSWLLSTSTKSSSLSCKVMMSDRRYLSSPRSSPLCRCSPRCCRSSCPRRCSSSLVAVLSFSFRRGLTFSCRWSMISETGSGSVGVCQHGVLHKHIRYSTDYCSTEYLKYYSTDLRRIKCSSVEHWKFSDGGTSSEHT